jgi:phosphoribosylglycinamide formyltransferase 1
MTRMVVLISGTGRNLQAILEALRAGRIHGEVSAVISNNPDAAGLAHARTAGVSTAVVNHRDYPDRDTFDMALSAEIDRHAPDFVILAGFMRILGSDFVQRYRGKLLNIHPSLLPKYPGLQTHARALAEGEAWHGASVHFVTEAVDGGPVILQGRVPVQGNDTVDTLAERVMREVEQVIYPEALAWASAGRLQMRGNEVVLDGRVLTEPLLLNGSTTEMKHG